MWFDSGAMPFAQWHYPFENRELIDKNKAFPADFIAEAWTKLEVGFILFMQLLL